MGLQPTGLTRGDQGFDHLAARQAHDVGDDRVELDACILKRLLQTLDMPAALPHQLLARGQQVAHLLGLLVRHKTAADQAMGQQIGEPGGVIYIGLAPRHIFDVRRVRQHQLKIAVAQDVPHRLPIDPGRLHRDMGAALGGEPFRQRQQFRRGRLEGPHLSFDRAVHRMPYTRHHRVLVHSKPSATRIQNFHLPSCRSEPPGVGHLQKNSGNRGG